MILASSAATIRVPMAERRLALPRHMAMESANDFSADLGQPFFGVAIRTRQ